MSKLTSPNTPAATGANMPPVKRVSSYGPALLTDKELASMRELAKDYGVSVASLMADRQEEISYLREMELERQESVMRATRRAAKDLVMEARNETAELLEDIRRNSPLWKLANRLTALVGLSVDIILTAGVHAGGHVLKVEAHTYEPNEEGKRVHLTEVIGYAHEDAHGVVKFRTAVGSEEFIGISGVVAFISEAASRVDLMPTAHVMKAAKKSGHSDVTGERATPGSEQGSERSSIARPSRQGEHGLTDAERRASNAARVRRFRAKKAAELAALETAQGNLYRTAEFVPKLRKGPKPESAASYLPNLKTIDNR